MGLEIRDTEITQPFPPLAPSISSTMAVQKRSAHAWTYEQRICVQILWEEHSISNDDRAEIFNEIFKDCFVVGDGRTWKSLTIERSRRLQHGTHSRKAWQAVCSIVDDVQEHLVVEHMRRRVATLLRANNESLTPSRSPSSDSDAQTAAVLWNVEKFANFTESTPRKRNIAALCTPPSTTDGRADESEETPRDRRHRRPPRAQSPAVIVPKACKPQTLRSGGEVEEPSKSASASTSGSKTTRDVEAIE